MLNFVRNLSEKLARTKNSFVGKIAEAIKLRGVIDEELMLQLEEILIKADSGVEMADYIITKLKEEIQVNKIDDPNEIQAKMQHIIEDILLAEYSNYDDFFSNISQNPYIVFFLGVNGVGKTTSIGKIAAGFRESGKSVLVVAGDTFRAAAIEQLGVWAERSGATIIKSQQGSDPSSIVYDGIQSALAKHIDVVLIDTAGRQHTKTNLMQELSKMIRTIKKVVPDAPHETLLVLDSTTGQNALSQAKSFHEATNITGLVLTKFDGTSKGGIILNIKQSIGVPVKLIGTGEQIEDLQPFNPKVFVEALFS